MSYLGENSKSINSVNFSKKAVLAVGSEARGVDKEVLSLADEAYIIPMEKGIESLNVGVAASISMFFCNEEMKKIKKK